LEKTTVHLCRIAAALCRSDESILRRILREALAQDISTSQIREVILTSYLFDGYPSALEGFRILAELVEDSPAAIADLEYNPANIQTWRERGGQLCRAVYGPQFDPLMQRVAVFAPELKDGMIVEGYGKVLARDRLDVRVRELCIVAMLAVKSRPRQMLSHALGALRLGADPSELKAVMDAITDFAEETRLQAGRAVIERAIQSFDMP